MHQHLIISNIQREKKRNEINNEKKKNKYFPICLTNMRQIIQTIKKSFIFTFDFSIIYSIIKVNIKSVSIITIFHMNGNSFSQMKKKDIIKRKNNQTINHRSRSIVVAKST